MFNNWPLLTFSENKKKRCVVPMQWFDEEQALYRGGLEVKIKTLFVAYRCQNKSEEKASGARKLLCARVTL